MRQLFARLIDKSVSRIFTESELVEPFKTSFVPPQVAGELAIKFDPERGLVGDEWYYVTLTTDQITAMIEPYSTTINSTADINTVTDQSYSKIDCIFLIDGDANSIKHLLFYRVQNSYRIAEKKFLHFVPTGTAEVVEHKNSIEISGHVDAYWDPSNSRLYFKKYTVVKPLFKDFEAFYREASAQEVTTFLQSSLFSIQNTFKRSKIGPRALSHIAAILDSKVDLSSDETRAVYTTYANEFSELQLTILENGQFSIAKPSDLTSILYLLLERLYVSPVTKEKRVANSTSRLGATS